MVEMSTSGSGEGPGKATTRGYSTAAESSQRPSMGIHVNQILRLEKPQTHERCLDFIPDAGILPAWKISKFQALEDTLVRARYLVMCLLASPNIWFSTNTLDFQIGRIGTRLAP